VCIDQVIALVLIPGQVNFTDAFEWQLLDKIAGRSAMVDFVFIVVLLCRVGSGPDQAITTEDEPVCGLIARFP